MKRQAVEFWSLFAALFCALFGCAAPAASSIVAPTADKLPVLRVGTSGDYSPFSVLDETTQSYSGFDIDVARQMAVDWGVRIEWVPFEWPQLQASVEANRFDIAMSGVTWRPTRAVVGHMTQAVAIGAPCLLGDPDAQQVAVNRGGALEAWAVGALAARTLLTVDDNRSLPDVLASGQVGALVTDSFELAAFQRPGWISRCELPTWRKVYWLGTTGEARWAQRVRRWLAEHRAVLQRLRLRWFGNSQVPSPHAQLEDLLSRRLALMPHVAADKAQAGLPTEDLQREARLLERVSALASERGWAPEPLTRLFQLQMQLAKAVQRRAQPVKALDLNTQLRPLLSKLSDRIVDELSRLQEHRQLATLSAEQLPLLSKWLNPEEVQQMAVALRGPWVAQ